MPEGPEFSIGMIQFDDVSMSSAIFVFLNCVFWGAKIVIEKEKKNRWQDLETYLVGRLHIQIACQTNGPLSHSLNLLFFSSLEWIHGPGSFTR